MSYNKTTWKSGDVVTSEKLNNMENGIAAASIPATGMWPVVTATQTNTSLDIKPEDLVDNYDIIIGWPVLVNVDNNTYTYVHADALRNDTETGMVFIGVGDKTYAAARGEYFTLEDPNV